MSHAQNTIYMERMQELGDENIAEVEQCLEDRRVENESAFIGSFSDF